MADITKLMFFTWHYIIGWNPHSVMVLAESKEIAILKILRCANEGKILRLEGPYTKSIDEIIKEGLCKRPDGPLVSLETFLRKNEPVIMDIDCLVSASALDG